MYLSSQLPEALKKKTLILFFSRFISFYIMDFFCTKGDEMRSEWLLFCLNVRSRAISGGLKFLANSWESILLKSWSDGWRWERLCLLLPSASLFVIAVGGNWPLSFAARFSCCTTALFIKREAACSKLLQIIAICLQSPEPSSKPAPILPSNFSSQNWTCGSFCVWQRPSLPPAGALRSHSTSPPLLDA